VLASERQGRGGADHRGPVEVCLGGELVEQLLALLPDRLELALPAFVELASPGDHGRLMRRVCQLRLGVAKCSASGDLRSTNVPESCIRIGG
jgi:hypothetical protein